MIKYINANELIEEIIESRNNYFGDPIAVSNHNLMCDNTISWIEGAATADVVEIVRCKDCKRSHCVYVPMWECDVWTCDLQQSIYDGNSFCWCGERKTDG